MATLTVKKLVDAGTPPTLGAASVSDRADIGNGINSYLHYKNASGASVTVSVKGAGTTDYGVDMPDNAVVIANNAEAFIPLRRDYDQGDGLGAEITIPDATGVTVALVRLG